MSVLSIGQYKEDKDYLYNLRSELMKNNIPFFTKKNFYIKKKPDYKLLMSTFKYIRDINEKVNINKPKIPTKKIIKILRIQREKEKKLRIAFLLKKKTQNARKNAYKKIKEYVKKKL